MRTDWIAQNPDHYGSSESRTAWHNSRFGMRTVNKSDVTIFPFQFSAPRNIIAKRLPDAAPAEE